MLNKSIQSVPNSRASLLLTLRCETGFQLYAHICMVPSACPDRCAERGGERRSIDLINKNSSKYSCSLMLKICGHCTVVQMGKWADRFWEIKFNIFIPLQWVY